MPVSIAYKGDQVHFKGLKCACGQAHHAPTQDFYIGSDMAAKLPRYVKKRELGKKAVVISDPEASDRLGRALLDAFRKEGFEVTLALLTRPLADERSLGEAMLAMRMDTEFFVAAGGEEAASVARAAAALTERPYVLLATRPTGTSYLSEVAQMSLKGEAMALPAVAPELVAFDLDALTAAPPESFAQGLLDLTACTLARADWAAMKLLKGDAYCPMCADMAAEAAERALEAADEIAGRSEKGAKILAESLMAAGIAALVSGGVRPVSSAAQALARKMALSAEASYPAALSGAVAALLTAYRCFDPDSARPGGDKAAREALSAHREGLRQILDRLPSGEAAAAAVQSVAPELTAAVPPLEPPRAAGIAACQSLVDFAALAGCLPET
jgi:glycerol dehydrogenase-like iron-containing ADH family enzyme